MTILKFGRSFSVLDRVVYVKRDPEVAASCKDPKQHLRLLVTTPVASSVDYFLPFSS
jgi:hypothetical protein